MCAPTYPSGQAQFPTGATLRHLTVPAVTVKTQRHCRNSIPTNSTWTELQGETGAYPECATLCSIQMVCTLSNLQNCSFWAPPGWAGLEASWGDRLSAFVAPAPWSSSLVWLPLPRHPSTSRLKAWARLSRANLYLQGIRL